MGLGFTLPSYKLLLLEKVRSAYVSKRHTLSPETIFVSEATSHAERTLYLIHEHVVVWPFSSGMIFL